MKYFKKTIWLCISIGLVLLSQFACAQKKDSAANGKSKRNIFKFAINAFTRNTSDSAKNADTLNTKSEAPFLPHEGKGIRHITIRRFGFEKVFTDTTKKIEYFGTKVLNYLHKDTRGWVIRDNLFIREKSRLNAFRVADNERYLRSLEYIQDARIIVETIPGEPDSVDLVVITKDLFSISGELSDANARRFKASISDANVLGMAQKVQFTALREQNRDPRFGFNFYYSKRNIENTFINATFSYSNINSNLTSAAPEEHAGFIMLERPLVSQYSHFAGAIAVGHYKSFNHYNIPDSFFYRYSYTNFDTWVGYNIGVKKFLNNINVLDRQFISLRYFNNSFSQTPYQIGGKFNFRYNDREFVLGQFTFFRQNFIKSNYIFGFGTTEDVPHGYNVAVTTGWYRQMQLNRLYAGIDANKYNVTNAGDVVQYFLRTGTFIHKRNWQDASVLIGTSMFSRLLFYRELKIRQYLRFSYTKQFNRIGLEPLGLSNDFGLRYFRSDSVLGNQRISLHTETFIFLKYKVFGFKFAPFFFGDVALLTPENKSFTKSGFYYGLGGGMRTRNENLVFGTIELRLAYFPRNAGYKTFKITLTSNLRFRYNTNYVHAPEIIQLNNDFENNVY